MILVFAHTASPDSQHDQSEASGVNAKAAAGLNYLGIENGYKAASVNKIFSPHLASCATANLLIIFVDNCNKFRGMLHFILTNSLTTVLQVT